MTSRTPRDSRLHLVPRRPIAAAREAVTTRRKRKGPPAWGASAPTPPAGTPAPSELARHARERLSGAVRIARWADAERTRDGGGRPAPGGTGALSGEAAERAAEALGLTAHQARADWDRARLAGLVELHGGVARPGWRLQAWDRDDTAALRGWVALLDAWSIAHPAPSAFAPTVVAEVVEAVPQLLSLLQLSAGPMPVSALRDLLEQRVAELRTERCEVPYGGTGTPAAPGRPEPGAPGPATPAPGAAGPAAPEGPGPEVPAAAAPRPPAPEPAAPRPSAPRPVPSGPAGPEPAGAGTARPASGAPAPGTSSPETTGPEPPGPATTPPAKPAARPGGTAADPAAGPPPAALLDWALDGLAAVGALTLEDDEATLTPLGNWAVWVKLEQICVAAQSPAGNIEQSAAGMLRGCARLTPGPARAEYRAWLAARPVGSAVAELLDVARGEDALLRGLAFEALRVVGAPAEPAVREVADEPYLRPYALLWLAEQEGGDPEDSPDVLTREEATWLWVDTAAAVADHGEGQLLVRHLESAVQGTVPALLAEVRSVGHPRTVQVLVALAAAHPDPALAKAVRRAAFQVHTGGA